MITIAGNTTGNVNFKELYKALDHAIKNTQVDEIMSLMKNYHIADFSDAVNKLPMKETHYVFNVLPEKQRAILFTHLDEKNQIWVVDSYSYDQVKVLFDFIHSDEVLQILSVLPEHICQKIVASKSENVLSVIKETKDAEKGTAAMAMNRNFISIPKELTIEQASADLKDKYENENIESFALIFLHDENHKLVGYVRVREILFNPGSTVLETIMIKAEHTLKASESLIKVGIYLKKYKLPIVPIVNSHNQMVGTIYASDLLKALQDKNTRTYKRMAAITGKTEVPYMQQNTFQVYKSRIVWILALLVTASFTQILMDNEGIFSVEFLGVIAPVLPLLMGSGGNAGGQANATIIRSLSIGEISTKDYLRVVWKEMRVATVIGLTVFVANITRMIIINSITGKNYSGMDLFLGPEKMYVWSSLAIFTVIFLAKFFGATMPIVAKKFKLDPAVVAGPLIATLIDLLAVMSLLFWYTIIA